MSRTLSLGSPSGVRPPRSNLDSLKLLLCSSALLAFGIVMVASSSIALTEPYFFKHLFFFFVGTISRRRAVFSYLQHSGLNTIFWPVFSPICWQFWFSFLGSGTVQMVPPAGSISGF